MTPSTFWSQTYSGCAFRYDDVHGNDYLLPDIAHHLSMICRYGGATKYHYSVAQHSAALAVVMEKLGHPPEECLYALFHDAVEAYVGDIRTPIKDHMTGIRTIEDQIQSALLRYVRVQFGIPVPATAPAKMKEYDRRIVNNEREVLMQPTLRKWYGMEGFPRIKEADPSLFVKMEPEQAKALWLTLLEDFTAKTLKTAPKSNVVSLATRLGDKPR